MPALIMNTREPDESFIEVLDLHAHTKKNILYPRLSELEKDVLVRKESMGGERHISVDPFSVRESRGAQSMLSVLPPLHPPTKPKFLSYSLPNSASSSPKFSTMLSKKKPRNLNQASSFSVNPFFHRDSIALTNLERLRKSHLMRSKSCGEGRTSAPPEEFDLRWATKSNSLKPDHQSNNKSYMSTAEVNLEHKKSYRGEKTTDSLNEDFKCGALCLFLPGFGKGAKPVRARKEEPAEKIRSREPENQALVVSKRVSLEKFECGSWRSSAILEDAENQKDASNLFYDLPLELIRCSASDMHSPVTTAFVFDKDRKGVLKKSSSRTTPKRLPDSLRHVRFSSSSPTSFPASPTSCFTADVLLHKAREDLNSFLEAQTA